MGQVQVLRGVERAARRERLQALDHLGRVAPPGVDLHEALVVEVVARLVRACLERKRLGLRRPPLPFEKADEQLERGRGGPAAGVRVPDPARLALGAGQVAAEDEQVRVLEAQVAVRRRPRQLAVEEPPPPVELARGDDTNTWCMSAAMLCIELENKIGLNPMP